MVDVTSSQGGDLVERERAFDDLLLFLAREAVGEMGADRSSIFILDEASRELWSRVALGMGGHEIRFPSNAGIAGHVATTGELLNVSDPYADARFNRRVDDETGYRTRSILCGPLRRRDGRIVGVLQILNKRGDGPFLAEDVQRFERVSARCALAIENALTYDLLLTAERRGAQLLVRSPKVLVSDRDHPFASLWWPPGHAIGWAETFVHQHAHLLAAIAGEQDVDPHGATFEDGYRAAEVCEALLRAAARGTREHVAYRERS